MMWYGMTPVSFGAEKTKIANPRIRADAVCSFRPCLMLSGKRQKAFALNCVAGLPRVCAALGIFPDRMPWLWKEARAFRGASPF